MSQLFFSRSSSSGGLLYNTVSSRCSRLLIHTHSVGTTAEDGESSAWADEELLVPLDRSSRSRRRRSSYRSRVRLRMRVKR